MGEEVGVEEGDWENSMSLHAYDVHSEKLPACGMARSLCAIKSTHRTLVPVLWACWGRVSRRPGRGPIRRKRRRSTVSRRTWRAIAGAVRQAVRRGVGWAAGWAVGWAVWRRGWGACACILMPSCRAQQQDKHIRCSHECQGAELAFDPHLLLEIGSSDDLCP